jgi:hypothetical protein
MDAYVHVQKSGSRVAVGVVIREGYETLSSAGWLHSDGGQWQALRDTIVGLCKDDVPMTINTSEQAAEMATNARQTQDAWLEVVVALHRAGSRVRWCGRVALNTGMADAKEKACLMLGDEPHSRGALSWRRNGRRR